MNTNSGYKKFLYISFALAVQAGLLPGSGLRALAADQLPAVSDSNASAAAIENYEAQLADLESQHGPYDQSLLEPLKSLVEIAERQQDYDRVAELQDRQLQVMRTVLGFQNPDLIPLLKEIINSEIHLQNWAEVSDQLEHMRFLVGGNDDTASPALLEVMAQQAYWYLVRVSLDRSSRRASNFMQARELYDDLLDKAEDTYGEDSPAMIPWLFKFAMNNYRLVELLNADDSVASDTIDRLVRKEGVARLQMYQRGRVNAFNIVGNNSYIPVVNEGHPIGEAYLRDAWNAMSDIGDIAEQQGDVETQAMALIYEADFQKLMNRGTALRKYRDAQQMLLDAGISHDSIDQFFNHPAIIPVPEFYSRLDDALAYQQHMVQGLEVDADTFHVGTLVAWQEAVPGAAQPTTDAAFLGVDLVYNQVDASFTVSASGRVSSIDIISSVPDERSIARDASRALRELNIRPAIIDGRARRSRDVHIRYLFLADEQAAR